MVSHPTDPAAATGAGTLDSGLDIEEKPAWSMNGLVGLLASAALVVAAALLFVSQTPVPAIVLLLLGLLLFTGITVVSPGEARVVQLFGAYLGTVRQAGLLLTLPLTTRRRVTVKVNNFETSDLKVNDADGNPVNIAAIVVWQVADTAKSVFAVGNATDFVATQSESALRHIAGAHPYDNAGPSEQTLRGATEEVADELAREIGTRISIAGLRVLEARISTLAYAPEIAQAMLQRQQASALIAAREKIVEGAVSMVENALQGLEARAVVHLDDERRAAMVSNLLVVLCSDSRATPVVNAGTLYQ